MVASIGKLYYTPTSCGAASWLAATIAGVPFDSEVVDLKSHKTASGADFYTINPKGNVPSLVTDHGLLNEGAAVLQYIADKAPESKLAPANGTYERYALQNIFNFIGTELHAKYGPLFNPALDDAGKKAAQDAVYQKLKYVENNEISSNAALNPEQPTIAGLYLFIVLSWSPFVGIDLSSYPNISAWQTKFAANPRVKEARDKLQAQQN